MTRPSFVQQAIGSLPGSSSYSGAWADYAISSTNIWGDGLFQDQSGVYRFLSEHCMHVFDTDATSIKIYRYISSTVADSEFACGTILTGSVGARYGTTFVCRLTAPDGTTGARTTQHSLPSGTKRVFVIGGAQSGSIGQHVQTVSFPAGSSVTQINEPSTGTVVVDGYGSKRLSHDGYVASGGVLSAAGGDVTLRANYQSRIAKLAPTEVYFCIGTNDLSVGVLNTDFQVSVDAWVTDTLAAAPGARIVLQSIFRRPALEATTAPGFRTAVSNVATARSLTYVDGLAILGASDMGSDSLHPKRRAQSLISAAIAANTSTSYRTLVYCDSIASGSCDPQNGTGFSGPIHLLRTSRG